MIGFFQNFETKYLEIEQPILFGSKRYSPCLIYRSRWHSLKTPNTDKIKVRNETKLATFNNTSTVEENWNTGIYRRVNDITYPDESNPGEWWTAATSSVLSRQLISVETMTRASTNLPPPARLAGNSYWDRYLNVYWHSWRIRRVFVRQALTRGSPRLIISRGIDASCDRCCLADSHNATNTVCARSRFCRCFRRAATLRRVIAFPVIENDYSPGSRGTVTLRGRVMNRVQTCDNC